MCQSEKLYSQLTNNSKTSDRHKNHTFPCFSVVEPNHGFNFWL